MAETPSSVQKIAAEALGTFVLVALGCGAAVTTGADVVATGLAFGIAVLTMTYVVGRITGGHFNPAVTVGAALGGRLPWRQVPWYVGAQVVGAVLGALVLFVLLQGFPGYEAGTAMGQNGFGDQNANDYAWWAAFLAEAVLTALFVYVVLGVTDERHEHPALAPAAIGLALAAIYFVAIPMTGGSVNPARSLGPALFAGWDAIAQLWLFILAPLAGAAVAGITYPLLFGRAGEPVPGSGLARRRSTTAAAPAYGGSDAFQPQWNLAAPGVVPAGGDAEAGTTTVRDDTATGAGYSPAAEPAGTPPRIVQDGWEWDYAAQQWKPVQDTPEQRG